MGAQGNISPSGRQSITVMFMGKSSFVMDNNATDDIQDEILRWEVNRPATLQPLYFLPADLIARKPFPTIYYTSTEHGNNQSKHTGKPGGSLIKYWYPC
jgi:hypothetical protein